MSLVALAWCPKTKGAKKLLPAATGCHPAWWWGWVTSHLGTPSQMLSIPMKKIMVTLFPLENMKLQQALLALATEIDKEQWQTRQLDVSMDF